MPDDTPQDAPLTGADLRTYLDTQDDFAFEREMFTHAYGYGLTVQHTGLYEDPATSKLRQFDIRAMNVSGNHRIRLAIECKSLRPTYPLVVSCVPRTDEESYHYVMFTRPEPGLHGSHTGVKRVRSALYVSGDYVGKDMCQIGRDKRGSLVGSDGGLFDKYQQAMASSSDLIAEAADDHRVRYERSTFTAVLPILVVPDGTLWGARYSSRGRLEGEPVQTNEVTFYLGRDYPLTREGLTFTISHLQIMTKSGATELLRQVGEPRPQGIWEVLFR
jgi:hypothetical protein